MCLYLPYISHLPPGLRLNIDNVFKVLQRTGKNWRWLAEEILWISSSKCDDIERLLANDDDRLKDAIQFWLKRHVYASWRWIIYCLALEKVLTLADHDELLDFAEPLLGKRSKGSVLTWEGSCMYLM